MDMSIFELNSVLFSIIFFGSLFLIGEILVNMRGVFGLLGISLITIYFYVYLVEPSTFILMIIVYFLGLLLIVVDGKAINDGTLAIIGLACMLLTVALAAPSITSAFYAIAALLSGTACSFVLLKMFKRREMWNKIKLTDRLTKDKGYSSLNMKYEELVGKKGITITTLRPVGTIQVGNDKYSAVSNGQWIDKGSEIKIVEVDGTKILVEIPND